MGDSAAHSNFRGLTDRLFLPHIGGPVSLPSRK
jgi:hypothetical protein